MVDINRRAIHEILNTHVMFAMLDDVDKAVVASIFEARAFARDQVVAEQGTAIEGLYIVHSGRVRLKEDAEGKIESLGLSGTGSSFGEMSLLEDADWDYQIVAADDRVVMFFAPADSIRELVEDQPSIKEHFRATVGLVELAGLVRGLLGDAEYEQKDFLDILKKVGVKVVRQGETVFEQGIADPRLYFIERGQVDISWQPVEGDPIILDRESRGSLIGVPGALADIEPDGILDSAHPLGDGRFHRCDDDQNQEYLGEGRGHLPHPHDQGVYVFSKVTCQQSHGDADGQAAGDQCHHGYDHGGS